MRFTFTIQGITWTVKTPSGLFGGWPPLLAAATTIGRTTVYDDSFCPDAISLAHEFCHVLITNTLRYILSKSIGRLWKSTYWKDQETMANNYGSAHALDRDFVTAFQTIRAALDALPNGAGKNIPTVTINHPV